MLPPQSAARVADVQSGRARSGSRLYRSYREVEAVNGQRANMADLARWTAEGKLSADVHAVYPLKDWPVARKAIAARKVLGKVILRV